MFRGKTQGTTKAIILWLIKWFLKVFKMDIIDKCILKEINCKEESITNQVSRFPQILNLVN